MTAGPAVEIGGTLFRKPSFPRVDSNDDGAVATPDLRPLPVGTDLSGRATGVCRKEGWLTPGPVISMRRYQREVAERHFGGYLDDTQGYERRFH